MPQIKVHNLGGDAAGELALNDTLFGAPVRGDLMHAAVVAQLAAKRAGTQSALTRGEVRGGGKKPYRQKGTGRARQGSTRSPQWKGGGVVFAPKPRSYEQKLPRKVRQAALRSAWSDHAACGTLVVVDALALEVKTKAVADTLKSLLAPFAEALAATMPAATERGEGDTRPGRRVRARRHVMLLLGPDELALRQATRNLASIEFDLADKKTVTYAVQVNTAPYASVYDLVWADVVVASASALARVSDEFAPQEETA
ncbi:MAG: 50S ribosomal protein L4 [Armatimonadetes bacterium]|nr:50S ribosomal protein L4 [Armatimonadota bacterium]